LLKASLEYVDNAFQISLMDAVLRAREIKLLGGGGTGKRLV
jgi:hypothetical protein